MGFLAIVLLVLAVAVYVAIGLAFTEFYPLANGWLDHTYIVMTWPFTLALLIAVAPFVLAYEGVHRLIQRAKGGARG